MILPRRMLTLFVFLVSVVLGLASASSRAAEPAWLAGYADFAAFEQRIKSLDQSDLVALRSLGKTTGGRDVWLVTLGTGAVKEKPAILVVGNVHAPHLLGGELAEGIARRLVEKHASDDATKKLLERFTIYVIPRPNPDGSEACRKPPYFERNGNARPSDDDRDGERGEDPFDDLNGDGLITMLRVADDGGSFKPHPDDPRVLIEVDPKKNERGTFSLHTEGRDNDGDGQFNEDPGAGVAFNRNFPHRYPYFQPGAGPNAVSEPETRAVADFAYDHPQIAYVLCFSPEDNLIRPWAPNPASEGQRIKTAVLGGDAPYLNFVAEAYQKIHGGKDPPAAPAGAGSFSEWSYFQYGRWTFSARGWWVPQVAATAPARQPEKKSSESRGAEQLNQLRWLEREKIAGFVPWTAIEHPDFPGRKVEVGGFAPFVLLNPPAKEIPPLVEKHCDFVARLGDLSAKLRVEPIKAESLGGGVHRLTVSFSNEGYLPTMSAMGRVSAQPHPLQALVKLPKGASVVGGSPRVEVDVLAGGGGRREQVWLIKGIAAPAKVEVEVWSPAVGRAAASVDLK